MATVAHYRPAKFNCNAPEICAQMRVHGGSLLQTDADMSDTPPPCDISEELIRLKQPLPHLVQALTNQRKIRIVAIGSSSTAGEGDIVPFPYRLELALRKRFPDR